VNVDLTPDAQEAAFVTQARDWLARNIPSVPLAPPHTDSGVAAHRAWERCLHDAGYGAMAWPQEYGGGGAGPALDWLFTAEYLRARGPERINRLGLGLVGPTIIAFGEEWQKQRWLPPILDCSELWCQGFSEPGAGSDLAAIRTQAIRDGDHYVVNGQKTWTSLAPHADWMAALVRTEPASRRHHGLTFLLIPMRSPEIDVRPLRQLHGEPGFAEVFFTDLRVPVRNALGPEGEGWKVAMTMLRFERAASVGHPARFLRDVDDLVELVRAVGLDSDPVVADALAARHAEARIFATYMDHVLTQRIAGGSLDAGASVAKLYWSELEARIYETVLDVIGPLAEIADAVPGSRAGQDLLRRYWHARASRIYAGTSEVQRNIIAERILGLPREPQWTSV
jgi:alkylation response protein AidB-like acyl-CoA dehydrogenase